MKILFLVLLTIVAFPLEMWRSLDQGQKLQIVAICCDHEAEAHRCQKVMFRIKVNNDNATIQTQCMEEM